MTDYEKAKKVLYKAAWNYHALNNGRVVKNAGKPETLAVELRSLSKFRDHYLKTEPEFAAKIEARLRRQRERYGTMLADAAERGDTTVLQRISRRMKANESGEDVAHEPEAPPLIEKLSEFVSTNKTLPTKRELKESLRAMTPDNFYRILRRLEIGEDLET